MACLKEVRWWEQKTTRYEPGSLSKLDAGVLVEIPRKLHWWDTRKRLVHMQHASSRLEKMWPWKFASRILYNLGDFDPKGRKAEWFHRRSVRSAPVFKLSCFQLSLSHSSPSVYFGKLKEKKLIISLYISVVAFLCDATIRTYWTNLLLQWNFSNLH